MPIRLYDGFEFSFATKFNPDIHGGGAVGGALTGHTDDYINLSADDANREISVGHSVRIGGEPGFGSSYHVTAIYYSAITTVQFVDGEGNDAEALVNSITVTTEDTNGAERVFTFLTGSNVPEEGFGEVSSISFTSSFPQMLNSVSDDLFPELFEDRESSIADPGTTGGGSGPVDEVIHDLILTSLSDIPSSNEILEFSDGTLSSVADNVTVRHDQTDTGEIGVGDELVINGITYEIVEIGSMSDPTVSDQAFPMGQAVSEIPVFVLENAGTGDQFVALGMPDDSNATGTHQGIFQIEVGDVDVGPGQIVATFDLDGNNNVSLGAEPSGNGPFEFSLHDAIRITAPIGEPSPPDGVTLSTGVGGQLLSVEDGLELVTRVEGTLSLGDTLVMESGGVPTSYSLDGITVYQNATADLADGSTDVPMGARAAYQLVFSRSDGQPGEDLVFLVPSDSANSNSGDLPQIISINVPGGFSTPPEPTSLDLSDLSDDNNVSLAPSLQVVNDVIRIDATELPAGAEAVFNVGGLEEVHDDVFVETSAGGTVEIGSTLDLGGEQVTVVSTASYTGARIEYSEDGSNTNVISDYSGDLWLVEYGDGSQTLLMPQVDGVALPEITSISFVNATVTTSSGGSAIDQYGINEDVSIGDPQVYDLIEVARPLTAADSGAKLETGIDLLRVEDEAVVQGAGPQGNWQVGTEVEIDGVTYVTLSIQEISGDGSGFNLVSGDTVSSIEPLYLVSISEPGAEDIKQFIVTPDSVGDLEGISSISLGSVSFQDDFIISNVADNYSDNDTVTLSTLQPEEDAFIYDAIRISSDLAGTDFLQTGTTLTANAELVGMEEPLVLPWGTGDGDSDLDIGEYLVVGDRSVRFEGHIPVGATALLADGTTVENRAAVLFRFVDDDLDPPAPVDYLVFHDQPSGIDLPGVVSVTITSVPFTSGTVRNLNDNFGSDDDVFLACFCRGTQIETENGLRKVECLQVGDLVRTVDNGYQPIKWVGSRSVPGKGKFRPVRISYEVGGKSCDLFVSPQHRVLISPRNSELLFFETEVLTAAKFLVDAGVAEFVECDEVEYFHIMFEEHEIVYSNHIATESFLPIGGLVAEDNAGIMDEFTELFHDVNPQIEMQRTHQTCRRCLKEFEMRCLRGDFAFRLDLDVDEISAPKLNFVVAV